MRRFFRNGLGVASAVAMICAAGGCVTESGSAAPPRDRTPVRTPPRPSGIEPQQMLLSASIPSDADGNAFPDTIPVTVYLFGDTRRYNLPLADAGSFEFIVATTSGQEIGRWRFDEAQTADARGDSPAGKCFRFALRLGPGRDRFRSVPVSLRAIFTNAKTGQKVVSPAAANIRLGLGE